MKALDPNTLNPWRWTWKSSKFRDPTIVGSSSPGRRKEILKPDYFEPEYTKPEEPKPENPGPEASEYRYSGSGFWGFDFRIWGKNLNTHNFVEIVKPWTLDPEPKASITFSLKFECPEPE